MSQIKVEHTESVGFSNDGHFHNFINYLLRVDKSQKWSTKNTPLNIYYFIDSHGDLQFGFCGDVGERSDLKKEMYKVLMPHVRQDGSDVYRNDIAYLDIGEVYDPNSDDLLDVLIEVFKLVRENSIKDEKETIYVMHLDQENFHIHSLFNIKNKNYNDEW